VLHDATRASLVSAFPVELARARELRLDGIVNLAESARLFPAPLG